MIKNVIINLMERQGGKTSLACTRSTESSIFITHNSNLKQLRTMGLKAKHIVSINSFEKRMRGIIYDKIIIDDFYCYNKSIRESIYKYCLNIPFFIDVEIYCSDFDENIYKQSLLWKICFDRAYINEKFVNKFSYEDIMLFSYDSNNKCLFDNYIYDFSTYDENVKIFKYIIKEI